MAMVHKPRIRATHRGINDMLIREAKKVVRETSLPIPLLTDVSHTKPYDLPAVLQQH